MPPSRRARGWSHTPPALRAATRLPLHPITITISTPPRLFLSSSLLAGFISIAKLKRARVVVFLQSQAISARVAVAFLNPSTVISRWFLSPSSALCRGCFISSCSAQSVSPSVFIQSQTHTLCRCRFFFHHQQSLPAFGFIIAPLFLIINSALMLISGVFHFYAYISSELLLIPNHK
jgi:hypothetical protein